MSGARTERQDGRDVSAAMPEDNRLFPRVGRRDKLVVLSCVVFSLVAHLFRWSNTMFNHDSTLIVQCDLYWQTSLGRFLNPIYVYMRGRTVSPMLVGLMAVIFMTASALLVVRILDIRGDMPVVFTCAALTTNSTITLVNASYLLSLDLDCLALLLSVAAVYATLRWRHGWVGGVALTCASLGIFQAYFQVEIVLFLLHLLRRALLDEDPRETFLLGLKAIGVLLAGGVIYFFLYRAARSALGLATSAATYNGVTEVGNFEGYSVFALVIDSVAFLFRYLATKTCGEHAAFVGVANILVLVAGLVMVAACARAKRVRPQNVALAVLMLVLLPLGTNCTYVLSKGMVHGLMVYSFFVFAYVGPLMLLDMLLGGSLRLPKAGQTAMRAAAVLVATSLVLCNVEFSNHLYTKKALEAEGTISAMTQVLIQMEATEGYVPGETPVAFVGNIRSSSAFTWRPGMEFPDYYIGDNGVVAVTYYDTYEQYLVQVLGARVVLSDLDENIRLFQTDEVRAMPCFPDQGCCRIVDGVLVVKFSNDYDVYNNVTGVDDRYE